MKSLLKNLVSFATETGIVIDACVAYLANRMCGNKEKALRRWNEELDRLVK